MHFSPCQAPNNSMALVAWTRQLKMTRAIFLREFSKAPHDLSSCFRLSKDTTYLSWEQFSLRLVTSLGDQANVWGHLVKTCMKMSRILKQ